MAHAFKTISAKPTFGVIKDNMYQSDYIARKKGASTFCNIPQQCHRLITSDSYSTLNSFNVRKYTTYVNKSNLISGQYTKENLTDVCTVTDILDPLSCSSCSPCQNNTYIYINPNAATTPFYYSYQIDPLGELFGNTQCGELNFTRYREIISHDDVKV